MNFFSKFIYVSVYFKVATAYVCILQKRPDPDLGGILRLSLSFKEICLCQAVVAPMSKTGQICNMMRDESCANDSWLANDPLCKLWFVDDPSLLVKRVNWKKERLDSLLQRSGFCGKYFKKHL